MIVQNRPALGYLLLNGLWFQAGWLICVLLGNLPALIFAVATFVLYLWIRPLAASEWPLIISVVLLGLVVDTGLSSTGILVFQHNLDIPPIWLVVIWFAFATTLNGAIRSIVTNLPLMVLFSGIGGTLSYVAGVRLSPAEFGIPTGLAVSIICITWLVIGYLLHIMFKQWKRITGMPRAD